MKRRRGAPTPLTGTIEVPGDKSISHRALILAAGAPGRSVVRGLNDGADVQATADALAALGAESTQSNGGVHVEGCGWTGLAEPDRIVDAGNSGTTLRLLLGIAAGIDGLTVLTGDPSLRSRPMLRVVSPLRQMGASIDGRAYGEHAPLVVRGAALGGIDIDLPVASAQVKSAILLAGARATGTTSVSEPGSSRDHTERMMMAAGAPVTRSGTTTTIEGGWQPEPFDMTVPGDLSSALFLVAAALLVEGSDLTIENVGLNPTRSGALEVLTQMGARLRIDTDRNEAGEPLGSIGVTHAELVGVTLGPDSVPSLIDEIPILAVVATQAEGETVISGAAELRVKESDRIATMVEGLKALGADVSARPDGMVVRGPTRLLGGEVDARHDHRVAMAFAIAGLVAADRVRIAGWSSVETSFPTFLQVLGQAQSKR